MASRKDFLSVKTRDTHKDASQKPCELCRRMRRGLGEADNALLHREGSVHAGRKQEKSCL